MKKIEELLYTLNPLDGEKEFERQYPQYHLHDGKTHILYVSPCLNETGYYRMMAPMLEINGTQTHVAIIPKVHKYAFNKRFGDYDNPIDERLVRWAHYVVLPSIFSSVAYILEAMRRINPELAFVMDIDRFYHAMPPGHPDRSRITGDGMDTFLENLSMMDMATYPDKSIGRNYKRLLDKHPSNRLRWKKVPNLISGYGVDEQVGDPEGEVPEKGPGILIGIPGNAGNWHDISTIKDVLAKILERYGDKVAIIFLEWNGTLPGGERPLEPLTVRYQKFIQFKDRLKQWDALGLDMALLPSLDIPYNTSRTRYLELSILSVPVIASNVHPYRGIITNGETGFLVDTADGWSEKVDTLVQNPRYRYEIGRAAMTNAWFRHSFSPERLKALKDVFV